MLVIFLQDNEREVLHICRSIVKIDTFDHAQGSFHYHWKTYFEKINLPLCKLWISQISQTMLAETRDGQQ